MPEFDRSLPRVHQPQEFADTALPEYYIRYIGGVHSEDHGYLVVTALPAINSFVEIKLPLSTLRARVLFIEPEFTAVGPKAQHFKVHITDGVVV